MTMPEASETLLTVVPLISSCFSVVGCAYIIGSSVRLCRKQIDSPSEMELIRILILILAMSDFCNAAAMGFGRFFLDQMGENSLLCTLQASMINFFSLSSAGWNLCISFNMYRWVVKRDEMSMLRSYLKYYLAGTFIPPLILTIFQLSMGMYGDASVWCWLSLEYEPYRFYSFYFLIFFMACSIITLLGLVRSDIKKRMRTHVNADVEESSTVVLNNLFLYMITFVLLWSPSFIYRFIDWITEGDHSIYFLKVLHTFSLPLQGFVNAMIYGGFLSFCKVSRDKKEIENNSISSFIDNLGHHLDNDEYSMLENSSTATASTDHQYDVRRTRHLDSDSHASTSIFVSTFNMAEKSPPQKLENWIPKGHDVYVIGVQECMHLDELRFKILAYLEKVNFVKNNDSYTQYSREIGSTNTRLGYHGYIAITVYVRTSEINSGCFHMPQNSKQQINRGVSIGFGGISIRASNKGAVGFAFRYHNTSFAFVNCHFASDSKGKSKLSKRNLDAKNVIQDLRLDVDNSLTKFDFPLMHHHSVILGDLNYRLNLKSQITSHEICCKLLKILLYKNKSLQFKATSNTTENNTFVLLQSPSEPLPVLRSNTTIENNGSSLNSRWNNSMKNLLFSRSEDIENVVSISLSPISRSNYSQNPDIMENLSNRKIWKEFLNENDELLHMIHTDKVFCDFEESDICFAPSYRREINKSLVAFISKHLNENSVMEKNRMKYTKKLLKELKSCFAIKVKNQGDRIPSYTDRIIYHSLPDLKDRLTCEQYRISEDVSTSDHKPISCVFRVVVNKTVGNHLNSLPSCMSKKSRKLSGFRMKDFNGVVLCTVKMKDITIDLKGKTNIEGVETRSMNVLGIFPLPSEDIFSEQRKVHDLADKMLNGFSFDHRQRSSSSSGASSSSNASTLTSTASASKGMTSITSEHFLSHGLEMQSLVNISENMHLAIKLQGHEHHAVDAESTVETKQFANSNNAQCVVCLNEAFIAPSSFQSFSTKLTNGGNYVGYLSGQVSMQF